MTDNFNALQDRSHAEALNREQEAIWEALVACDDDTYRSVIALLGLKADGSRLE